MRMRLGDALNEWLHRDRCIAWSAIFMAGELVVLLYAAAFSYGLIRPLDKPISTDFVSFYAAGLLADAGTPALAYDPAAHQDAEDRARRPGIAHPVFAYPPVFLLVCAALARLPYVPAVLLFQAASLGALLLALRRILDLRAQASARWLSLLPFLAFPALLLNAAVGQNAALTAALFAWGLVLLPTRPVLAGLVLGGLCYKPHFGLLLPVALAAGRNWRAFAAAALSVAGCVGLSVAVFGPAPWQVYLAALPAMPGFYQSGHVAFAGMVSPLGAMRLLGFPAAVGYGVQAAAALLAAAAVAWVWWRRSAPALCAATLLAATLLTAPLVLFYDLVLAAVAIAFLVRHGRDAGWLAYEKPVLGLVVLLSLAGPASAALLSVPLNPLPACLLLALCLLHARRQGAVGAPRAPAAAALAA
jgi:hypothetical protein